jgi:cystathionine beta-synthase
MPRGTQTRFVSIDHRNPHGLAHANLLALDRTWGGPYHRGMPPIDDLSPAQRPAVLDLIGNTPLVQVTRLGTGPCTLLLKLESQNPGGSIKDRVGRSMIEAAERDGRLKPGGTVIEATAGNTGLGLALVARAKGYRVVLVVPDKMSTEKVLHLKALGAEVHITRSDVGKGHPDYYQDVAARLARDIPGAFFADQFNNPANPLAHQTSTAPEIWEQMQHRIDALVCGVGSGGTITGLSRFFREHQPQMEVVLADPKGFQRIGFPFDHLTGEGLVNDLERLAP